MVPLEIARLSERPDLLPTVAGWIYEEWWEGGEDASVGKLTDLLRPHLVPGQIPLTLVALQTTIPVGTATLLEHDVGTEDWAELSPWMAAVYVVPEYRRRGIGARLVEACVAQASTLRVKEIYLLTVGREAFYGRLGWVVIDRAGEKTIMSRNA
jgi:predicted N-acetyltransferase YhbS